jgi:ATP-dependent RNA circularization protein (DNA/RNA ligase family)
MTAPAKYPRVPHLAPSPAVTADDAVLSPDQREKVLRAEVVVEEKLDGMNVMLWIDGGAPQVGTRGGADTSDRSGERGRVRSWASMHADELVACLGDGYVIYGEWLRRRHAVPYQRLPAELVWFDVFDRSAEGFLNVDARDTLLARTGVATPPLRFRGALASLDRLEQLFGPSAFADSKAEGLVIRTVDGSDPRIAKHIDPSWRHAGSAPWSGENQLATRTRAPA